MPRKKPFVPKNKTTQAVDQDETYDEIDQFVDQRNFVDLSEWDERRKDSPERVLENEVLRLNSSSQSSLEDEVSESSSESDYYGVNDVKPTDGGDESRWGKKKRIYYGTDYVDDELISSDEEAKEEEEQVLELQKRKAKELDEEDFMDTFGSILKQKDRISKPLPKQKISWDDLNNDDDVIEELDKEANSLNQREQIELLTRQSPELFKLLVTFKAYMKELKELLQPALRMVKLHGIPLCNGTRLFALRFHLLLTYCVDVCYYLNRMASGESTKDHPVIEQILQIRTMIEKLQPLEERMKRQIVSLLNNQVVSVGDSRRDQHRGLVTSDAKNQGVESGKDGHGVGRLLRNKEAANKHKFLQESSSSSQESEQPQEVFVRMKPVKRSFDKMLSSLEKKCVPPPPPKKLKLPEKLPEPLQPEDESESDSFDESAFAQLKHKAEEQQAVPHPQEPIQQPTTRMSGSEEEEDTGKRKINDTIQNNKGLKKSRSKKSTKGPRTKYREKYRKAVIRRRGQVQDVRSRDKKYSGEATGIKTHVIKSVPLK
eukprot:TRINITY_DN2309_c0_g1_i1.p1 TRINITY_DN2309_c0_g1~~TRINITY_DN2309_c0_g1_i1.p1  ORF type:complete len:543 (+),score=116.53 TRINITY_DN2309_c0_g1_i1:63-1691(+)